MHTSALRPKKPVGVFFTSKKILLMYLKKKRCSGSPSCSKKNTLKDHIEKKCFSTSKSSPKKDKKNQICWWYVVLSVWITHTLCYHWALNKTNCTTPHSVSGWARRSCHGDWPASSLVITDCGEMRGVKVEREALSPLSTEAWPLISDRHYNKH